MTVILQPSLIAFFMFAMFTMPLQRLSRCLRQQFSYLKRHPGLGMFKWDFLLYNIWIEY